MHTMQYEIFGENIINKILIQRINEIKCTMRVYYDVTGEDVYLRTVVTHIYVGE